MTVNMHWIDMCAECGKPLVGVRHGWKTVQVTWHKQARVHTLCIAKFAARTLDDQKARAA